MALSAQHSMRVAPDVAEQVVKQTIEIHAPGEATHWTALAVAEAAGVSVSSTQRIWRSPGLQPYRVRQFKLSRDPEFVPKLRDVVGLYVDQPAHAIVPASMGRARSGRSTEPRRACH
jgi:hypothetical protein